MVCVVYGAKNDFKGVDGQASNPRIDRSPQATEDGGRQGLYRVCRPQMDHRGTDTQTEDAGSRHEVDGRGGNAQRLGPRYRYKKKRQGVTGGKRGFTGMLWPEDKVAELKAMHKEGYSSGLIAEKLRMTRGQVVGKAWRLKLSFARAETPWGGHRVPSDKPKSINPIDHIRIARIKAAMKKNEAANLVKPNTPISTNSGSTDIYGLTTFKGVPTNCRAIVDGEGINARYCGQPVHKRSYCEEHFRRFYYAGHYRATEAKIHWR